MVEELKIARININLVSNGYYIRVEFDDNDDDWRIDKFIFETKDEVLAFLETNLD